MNSRRSISATASASPSASARVVEVVGARPTEHASGARGSSSATSDCVSSGDSGREAMPISGMAKRLQWAMTSASSGVPPEFDSTSATSARVSIPRSPCEASAGCRKNDGVPVEASVAAILRPTCPDLPMPETTIRPSQASISSIASAKLSPSVCENSASASASSRSTRRPISMSFSRACAGEGAALAWVWVTGGSAFSGVCFGGAQ